MQKWWKHSLTLLLSLTAVLPLRAQEQADDSKVKLISAASAQLIEKDGTSFRKVVGPAKFFHNNTYLLCDTALWNVSTNIIDAVGHVRIIQDQTQLSSETLQYVVDEDLARFRGELVQLEDKDRNTLRTRYLDYNTKDSVAVFQDGAAMRDKDGQVIESLYGTYDSKAHLFVFNDQVNMYMDTTFVRTSRLEYRSDLSTAYFGYGTDMWQDDKMLSANDGWYQREQELFMFRRKVHMLTEDQESWSDSLFYHRVRNDIEMLGNVELMDTTRNAYALAGRMEYSDSLSQIRLTREPAMMSITEEEEQRDTLYLGADVLLYRGIRRCDIPEGWFKASEKRLSDIGGDPVMEYRKKAAEAAAKAAEEAAKNDPNRPPEPPKNARQGKGGAPGTGPAKGGLGKDGRPSEPGKGPKDAPPAGGKPTMPSDTGRPQKPDSLPPLPDSLMTAPPDSIVLPSPDSLLTTSPDSLSALPPVTPPEETPSAGPVPGSTVPADTTSAAAPADTVKAEQPKDTTKVGFLWGSKRVRMFRRSMQMSSDSLIYSDLDSLVRLYQTPIFFNEGNRQYASDSIYMVIRNKRMEKAHLLSNAFITIQEDERSYDQVRGAEMVAYFDSTTALTRFDALGGAASLFYLEEQEALATVNKVESKMIYATFKDGQLERMYYYDNPKNDGYPSVQLPDEDKQLKGFRWEPERRPASPQDVTSLVPRPSERTAYLAHPHAEFKQTETYFPGYIKKVYRDIAVRDSLKVVRQRQEQFRKDSIARAQADSLALQAAPKDSLALADSLGVAGATGAASLGAAADSLKTAVALNAAADSLGTSALKDSLSNVNAAADSTAVLPPLTEQELKEQEKARQKAEQEKLKEEKLKAREAKWAEEDRIYEEKKAAKLQKKLEKERACKLKTLRKLEKRAAKERKRFERYLRREQEKAQKRKSP